jgi:DNA-binding transcriptional MocR family regulator
VSDSDVRLHIYETFVGEGQPPAVPETAEALGISEARVAHAYRRLAEGHYIVLEPGTLDIWMANPLSARPTGFRVRTDEGSEYFGSCVWDSPGVLAMLGTDGTVSTVCHDCDEPLTLDVRGGEFQPIDAVAHFAVPASRWWDDIGFS